MDVLCSVGTCIPVFKDARQDYVISGHILYLQRVNGSSLYMYMDHVHGMFLNSLYNYYDTDRSIRTTWGYVCLDFVSWFRGPFLSVKKVSLVLQSTCSRPHRAKEGIQLTTIKPTRR